MLFWRLLNLTWLSKGLLAALSKGLLYAAVWKFRRECCAGAFFIVRERFWAGAFLLCGSASGLALFYCAGALLGWRFFIVRECFWAGGAGAVPGGNVRLARGGGAGCGRWREQRVPWDVPLPKSRKF